MESITKLYRIGFGPSSSHTMGPAEAAKIFKRRHPDIHFVRVTLFGSLAATGRGHMTNLVIQEVLAPISVEFIWKPHEVLPFHPNGMIFEALDKGQQVIDTWKVFSIGGGEIREENQQTSTSSLYPLSTMREILTHLEANGLSFWEYVEQIEGPQIWSHLKKVWRTMAEAIERGLRSEGVLPGGLGLPRKAWAYYQKAKTTGSYFRRMGFLSAYALAVSEENATRGVVVTAPTCGSSGVLPAVLRFMREMTKSPEETILRALATSGLIGNLVKHNASISGAEVGCQGEIGTACAMAAGASVQILGGTIRQIEYAAEMGLEHHLGLTCDPVGGLVQIPCIERNAMAAAKALSCADYALFSDGFHRVSFDDVVIVMRQTGLDLPSLYRETASGGLAVQLDRK